MSFSEKLLLPLSQNDADPFRSEAINSTLSPTSDSRRISTVSSASSQEYNASTPRFAISDSAWADGLRGIAAVFVMCSHISLTIDTALVNPCCGPDERTPRLFQRPVFRLIAQGQTWVSIFILLSGFVNALKPIRQARIGDTQTALSNIAVSSFRRSFRLVLPAMAATFVSWTFEQLSFYHYARHGAAYWISATVPPEIPTLSGRLWDFFEQIFATWSVNDENHYDQPQWALIHLLMGSMFVFMSLVITIQLKPLWRALSLLLLYYASFSWSLKFRDPLVGMNTFAGMLLAELFTITNLESLPFLVRTVTTIFIPVTFLFSLVLMSVPMDNWASASWSKSIMTIAQDTMPSMNEAPRGVMSLSGQLLVLCIIMSPILRWILSTRPLLWLGKVSFGIYLLHGPLLRSVFAWCLYIGSTPVNVPLQGSNDGQTVSQYPIPGGLRIAISLVVLSGVVGVAAHVWTLKMEPIFAKITKRCENLMFQRRR